ncbi:MAG: HAD family phosphatase [Saprospiraceae bacterium]|nr:HAD family phosphatase [Saprospiraceae bacterium]MCB9319124.1 HAD family phosphatase [Lewinellaceae bacterium]
MNPEFGALFDMDGVLVDTNPTHKQTILNFAHLHGLYPDDQYLEEHVYGKINREWIPALFGSHLSMETIDRLAEEKEQLFRRVYVSQMVPLPGLVSFLELLRGYGISVALATSAPPENADFILDGLGVRHFFDAIVHSGHVTKGKPDPDVYLTAAARLGMPPSRCLVLEDSLAGIAAGLEAGCKVIGLTTTHDRNEMNHAHLVIDDFNQLDLETCMQLFQDNPR